MQKYYGNGFFDLHAKFIHSLTCTMMKDNFFVLILHVLTLHFNEPVVVFEKEAKRKNNPLSNGQSKLFSKDEKLNGPVSPRLWQN